MDDPCVHKLNTTMLTELRVSVDRAGDTAQHHKSRDWGVKRDVYRTHLIRPFSLTITPFKALKEMKVNEREMGYLSKSECVPVAGCTG